jgi:ubiquinone/menaquinone biosynthesis C-methylase UbiE
VNVSRDFFAVRAAGWDDRFPDDGPAFAAAVDSLRPPMGGTALDAGCGTGRALAWLRRAVGPTGCVIGLDLTPEMLAEGAGKRRTSEASLMLGDVGRIPLRDGSVDTVLGAGLLPHLADPLAGLRELARVTRTGGTLGLFHPIGRAALAARHRHPTNTDDPRAEPVIRVLLTEAGWQTELVDDGEERYLVVASRLSS